MPYRFALFDADNTLLDFTRSEHEALSDCLISRGLPHDKATTDRYAAINDRQWKLLEQGLTTREALRVDRFAEFFREFGFDFDPWVMADDYMALLSTKSYLMDGAFDLIQHLYGKCGLYLITNGNTSVQQGRFDPCPLAPMFDACFISEQMGCAKPEKVFFDRVAAAIPGFDPQEAIVIGDSLSSDIQGGIHAGLDTCWFNPSGKIPPANMKITYTVHSLAEIETILLS